MSLRLILTGMPAARGGRLMQAGGEASEPPALTVDTQPSATATAGAAFAQQPVITVGASGVTVTAAILTGEIGAALVGTVTAVSGGGGDATFSNLGIGGLLGAGYTLRFSAPGYVSVDSDAIEVDTPGAFANYDAEAHDETIPDDHATSGDQPGTASDAYGNPVAGVEVTAEVVHVFAGHDFDDGTLGPFENVHGDQIDFPDDPTGGEFTGKVARIEYIVTTGQSQERSLKYTHPTPIRYGREFWFDWELFMPSGANPDRDPNHNRKVFDMQGASNNNSRLTLHRVDGDVRYSLITWMSGGLVEVVGGTGIALEDDVKHRIQVRLVTNTADNLGDGILEIFIDGAAVADFSKTDVKLITENLAAGTGPAYLDKAFFGFQLTVDGGDPGYSEYRYLKNVYVTDKRRP